MSMYRISGTPNVQPMNVAASTALVAAGMVTMSGGTLAKSSSTDLNLAGICLQTIATTDSNYASAKQVLVDMLNEGALIYCDNVTGTLTQAMEGNYMDLSSTAGTVIDAGTSSTTEGNFLCVKFISATQGYFALAGSALTRPSA